MYTGILSNICVSWYACVCIDLNNNNTNNIETDVLGTRFTVIDGMILSTGCVHRDIKQ